MKKENLTLKETIKRLEKEKDDAMKTIDRKSEVVEKLKKEVMDLSVALNSEQFKSIRSLESELKKMIEQNKILKRELEKKVTGEESLRQEISILKHKTLELSISPQKEDMRSTARPSERDEKAIKDLFESIDDLTTKYNIVEAQIRERDKVIETLRSENEKLVKQLKIAQNN
eukprot:TRINITY_DN7005_c0_g2_i6.p1 TRINITY_DN7005_c0_g2~~TRINITY_DN7005_c0_g2_i6.p1  ORF type:complete len:172 (+),score=58.10 TRINITY_DN7005_c0_g2_i6:466-981(+)